MKARIRCEHCRIIMPLREYNQSHGRKCESYVTQEEKTENDS
jgi:hypothetical protein